MLKLDQSPLLKVLLFLLFQFLSKELIVLNQEGGGGGDCKMYGGNHMFFYCSVGGDHIFSSTISLKK